MCCRYKQSISFNCGDDENEENYQKSGWILEMCVTSDVKNEISAKDKIYRIDI